ncbi:hypothetical protein LCGC14_0174790 [marine sediment metagenome]|uniref:Uncharacterized protein n=1 Tax=marine sediment metagenome TaxID=412755 RepID=A0A0F9UR39_9ZZZZ
MEKRTHYKKLDTKVTKAGKNKKVKNMSPVIHEAFLSRENISDHNPLRSHPDTDLQKLFSENGKAFTNVIYQKEGDPLYEKILDNVILGQLKTTLNIEASSNTFSVGVKPNDDDLILTESQMENLIGVLLRKNPDAKKLNALDKLNRINRKQRKLQQGFSNAGFGHKDLTKIAKEQEEILTLIKDYQKKNNDREIGELSSFDKIKLKQKKKQILNKLTRLPDKLKEAMLSYDDYISTDGSIPKHEFSGVDLSKLDFWLGSENIEMFDKILSDVEKEQDKKLKNIEKGDEDKLITRFGILTDDATLIAQLSTIDDNLSLLMEEEANPTYILGIGNPQPAYELVDGTDRTRYLSSLTEIKEKIGDLTGVALPSDDDNISPNPNLGEIKISGETDLANAINEQSLRLSKYGRSITDSRRSHKRVIIDPTTGEYMVKAIDQKSGVIISYNSANDLLFGSAKPFEERAAVSESLASQNSPLKALNSLVNSLINGSIKDYDFSGFPSGRIITDAEVAELKALIEHLRGAGYSDDLIFDFISGAIEIDLIQDTYIHGINLLVELRDIYRLISSEAIYIAKEKSREDISSNVFDSEEWAMYFGGENAIEQMRELYDFRTTVSNETPYMDVIAYGEELGLFRVLDRDEDGYPRKVYSELDKRTIEAKDMPDSILRKQFFIDRIYVALDVLSDDKLKLDPQTKETYQKRAIDYQVSNWSNEDVMLQSSFFGVPVLNTNEAAKQRMNAISKLSAIEIKEMVDENPLLYNGLKQLGIDPDGDITELYEGVKKYFTQIVLSESSERTLTKFNSARSKGDAKQAFIAAEKLRTSATRIDEVTPTLQKLGALHGVRSYLNQLPSQKIVGKSGSFTRKIDVKDKETGKTYTYYVKYRPTRAGEKIEEIRKIDSYLKDYLPAEYDEMLNDPKFKALTRDRVNETRKSQNDRMQALTEYYGEKAHYLLLDLEKEDLRIQKDANSIKIMQLELLKEVYKSKLNNDDKSTFDPYDIFGAIQKEKTFQISKAELQGKFKEDVFKANELKYGFDSDLFADLTYDKSGQPLGDTPKLVSKDLKDLIKGFDQKRKSEISSETKATIKIPTAESPKKSPLIVTPKSGIGSAKRNFVTVSNRFSTHLTRTENKLMKNKPRVRKPTPAEKELIGEIDETIKVLKTSKMKIKKLATSEYSEDANIKLIGELNIADQTLKTQLNSLSETLPQKNIGADDFNKLDSKDAQLFTREEMKVRGATDESINNFYSKFTNIKQRDLYRLMQDIIEERKDLGILSNSVIKQ